jgi:hypothetical protein
MLPKSVLLALAALAVSTEGVNHNMNGKSRDAFRSDLNIGLNACPKWWFSGSVCSKLSDTTRPLLQCWLPTSANAMTRAI